MTDFQRDLVPPMTTLPPQDLYRRGSTKLTAADALFSATRNARLVLQDDGNLVLHIIEDVHRVEEVAFAGYTNVIWAAGTAGSGSVRCEMQDDGNLVLYDAGGGAPWATNTAGNPGAFLRCQDDGNLVLYGSDGKALWASNTNAGHRGGDTGELIPLPDKPVLKSYTHDINLVGDPTWEGPQIYRGTYPVLGTIAGTITSIGAPPEQPWTVTLLKAGKDPKVATSWRELTPGTILAGPQLADLLGTTVATHVTVVALSNKPVPTTGEPITVAIRITYTST